MDIADLVDFCLAAGDLAAGVPLSVLQVRSAQRSPGALSRLAAAPYRPSKAPRWTEAEDEFLKANLGYLPESQLAAKLGRSPTAVHLRWKRDLDLPAPLKHPDFLTAHRISVLLGVDGHAVIHWFNSGLLPGEIAASDSNRIYRRVRKTVFLRWLVNPANWIWFIAKGNPDPFANIADPHLHRLLDLKAARWGDAWWTTLQVAEYHGVAVQDVKRLIAQGKIAAIQAPNRGGRDNGAWAYWFVLKSEATRPDLHFVKGTGKGRHLPYRGEISQWPERADAFIVLARAVGHSTPAIAALMGWPEKRVSYRLACLVWSGKIAAIVEKYGLSVSWRLEIAAERAYSLRPQLSEPGDFSPVLFADWRLYRDRFPRLARSMDLFWEYLQGYHSYKPLRRHGSPPDLLPVRGVLRTWTAWRLGECPGSLRTGTLRPGLLAKYYYRLKERGHDPLAARRSEEIA